MQVENYHGTLIDRQDLLHVCEIYVVQVLLRHLAPLSTTQILAHMLSC